APERSFREGFVPVTADILNRVEGAADVRAEHALTIDGHPLHRARSQFGRPGHRDEPVNHAPSIEGGLGLAGAPRTLGSLGGHLGPPIYSWKPKSRAAFSEVTLRRTSSGV